LFQTSYIVSDDRVIGTEYRAELLHPTHRAFDCTFVKLVAKDVDAIGPCEIIRLVAVKVGEHHAGGGLHEGAWRQMPAYEAAELERHPVGVSELKIGNAIHNCGGMPRRYGKAGLVDGREPHEPFAAPLADLLRRTVGAEKHHFVVFIERQQRCQPPREPRM